MFVWFTAHLSTESLDPDFERDQRRRAHGFGRLFPSDAQSGPCLSVLQQMCPAPEPAAQRAEAELATAALKLEVLPPLPQVSSKKRAGSNTLYNCRQHRLIVRFGNLPCSPDGKRVRYLEEHQPPAVVHEGPSDCNDEVAIMHSKPNIAPLGSSAAEKTPPLEASPTSPPPSVAPAAARRAIRMGRIKRHL